MVWLLQVYYVRDRYVAIARAGASFRESGSLEARPSWCSNSCFPTFRPSKRQFKNIVCIWCTEFAFVAL